MRIKIIHFIIDNVLLFNLVSVQKMLI